MAAATFFAVARLLLIAFFTSSKRPANYLFKQNGDRKIIIWTRALQRPCSSLINPHSLPSFTVTRTLPYLSERQITFSCRYTQQQTAGNSFTCDWHTCQACHQKTSKRMCAWHILKFYHATSTQITLIFLVFLLLKFDKILHTLRYRCLLFNRIFWQNFLISVMFLKLLNFVISSKPLDKIFYFWSKLFFLTQFLLECQVWKNFTDGNSRNCFK